MMKVENKITLIRKSKTTYDFGQNDRSVLKIVARALTYRNPNPMSANSTIECFNKKTLEFDLGFLQDVIDCASESGYSVEIFGDEEYQGSLCTALDGRLYEHQRLAVEAFMKRKIGILKVPTRGGKTFIASEIVRQYLSMEHSRNVCFIVDNTTLFGQAINDLKTYFKPYGDLEVGELGGGRKNWDCKVTIVMVQTLSNALSSRERKVKRTARNFVKDCGLLIVDEVHDNCSDARLRLFRQFRNLDYQLSLSATPYRSGDILQNIKLKNWGGGVVYDVERNVLIERGVLSKYRVLGLMIDHDSKFDSSDYDYPAVMNECVYKNSERDALVAKFVDLFESMGVKTLLLFSSVEHGETYSSNYGAEFVHGGHDSSERQMAIRKFLEGRGGVLAASNIFKKGVTLPDAQVLINVDGGLEDANTIQRMGRVLGSTKTKTRSLVIDLFDCCERYLSRHSLSRLEVYESDATEDQIIVYDSSDSNWFDEAEEWIKDWLLNGSENSSSTR